MYKVDVNEAHSFEITALNQLFQLEGNDLDLDIRQLGNGHLHVLYQQKSYNIEVVSTDQQNKSSVIKVNGKVYTTTIEDPFDRLLKELGMETGTGPVIAEIKAPMPGLVLSVGVTEGQQILKGDSLLVLEAMKMENMLKSSTDGVVKKIHVSKGDKIEKNQVLITFV